MNKAGSAGDDDPHAVSPSIVGRSKHAGVNGTDPTDLATDEEANNINNLEISNPIEMPVVVSRRKSVFDIRHFSVKVTRDSDLLKQIILLSAAVVCVAGCYILAVSRLDYYDYELRSSAGVLLIFAYFVHLFPGIVLFWKSISQSFFCHAHVESRL